jgi:hypothetical protein
LVDVDAENIRSDRGHPAVNAIADADAFHLAREPVNPDVTVTVLVKGFCQELASCEARVEVMCEVGHKVSL